MQFWDLESGEEIRRFVGHTDAATDIAFTLDGLSHASIQYEPLDNHDPDVAEISIQIAKP